MADETEKRQLLKRIEQLKGLMRAAEHKINTDAHTLQKASSSSDVKQTALCKTTTRTTVQQCAQGSSALKCTQINKTHDQPPQGHNSINTHHENRTSDPDPSTRNSVCAVQVSSSQQCRRRMIMQLSKGNINCVQTQSMQKQGQVGNSANINSRTGGNAEKVKTEDTHTTADRMIAAAGNPCDQISLQTSQNKERTEVHRAREAAPVKSVKLTSHPSSAKSTIDQGLQTLASHAHSAQFGKDPQKTSTAIQLKQVSSCHGKTSGKECPSVSQSLPQAKTRKSLHKMQLALKNVQVIVARETMQSKIDLFKSTLAQLEVKRNKKIEARKKAGSLKACSAQAGKSTRKNDEKPVAEVAEKKICDVNAMKRESEVVFVTGKHLNRKQSSVMQTESSSSLKTCTPSQCDSGQITEERLRVNTKSEKSIIQHERVCLTVPSKSSQSSSSVDTKQDSTMMSKIGHTSLLKTSVKEDLQKELEATEDKLRDMRKKMGIMLKESSPKQPPSSSHAQLKKSYRKATSSSTTSISSAKPTSRLRPFVNRKSLRWTPDKSALRRSPEKVLVVGNSPNLRCFQLITGKATFPKSADRQVLSPPFKNRLFCRNVTPTSKRSKYTFIRKPGQPANTNCNNSPSKMTVFPMERRQQMSARKTFVHRYKLQRTSSDALKEQSRSSDLARRTLIKSRYKLRTLSTGGTSSQPCSFGLPLQASALHRAARIVKSKYKLRKVPIVGSPLNDSAMPWKQSFSVNCSWRSSHSFPVPPCNGRRAKLRNQKASTTSSNHQFNHRRVSTGFSTPPGRFQQSTYYPVSINKGLWKQRGMHSIPSDWFWAIQQRKNRFLAQQKSKAAAREQWKRQTQWIVSPQWWTRAYQTKTAMQQKKLLMKRLHWSRENNQLGRGQGTEAQKREQLVMINGIMYKSSSRRLTRASTSSLHGLTESDSSCYVSTSTPRAETSSSRALLRLSASRGKKTVLRVDFGGMTYVRTQEGVLEKVPDWQTRNIISRAKQRSISLAAAKLRRDNMKSKRKLCLFFSRFGKCSRGEQCPFVHDPAKIAVCTRFLRGTCHVENCPFSHKVSKEKMPVCAFFMRGVCARDPCPYLHVKVSEGAEICPDFIAGFCDLAENCPKLHTLTCPQYSKSGTCPNGKKCRLHHRKLKAARTHHKDSSSSNSSESSIALVSDQHLKRAAIPENQQDRSEKQSSCQKKRCKTVDVAQSQSDTFGGSSLPLRGSSEHKDEEAPSLEQTGTPEPSVDCCGSKAVSPKKPLNLPAFISLLNYSAEESPTPRTANRRGRKQFMMNTGTSLQIKPRI